MSEENLMSGVEAKIESGEVKPEGETTVAESILAGENPTVAENPLWFIRDGVPGEGEPPPYLKTDKYNSMEAQAKAYNELEKKFGSHKGAPEEYDLSNEKLDGVTFSKDDPVISSFLEYAKEADFSQGTVDKLLNMYGNNAQKSVPNKAEELAKLGENAEGQIATVKQWILNNFDESTGAIIGSLGQTAEGIRALQAMRSKGIQKSIPNAHQAAEFTPQLTSEAIQTMVNDERYYDDAAYRKEVQKKIEQFSDQKKPNKI